MSLEEKKPRPQVKVMGTSRNPDYNLQPSSSIPTFVRDLSGQRVMPLAQLNTFTGRFLAEKQSMKDLSYTDGMSRSFSVQKIRERMNGLALNPVSLTKDEKHSHDHTDRGHLPSQMLQRSQKEMLCTRNEPQITAQNLSTRAKKAKRSSRSNENLRTRDSCGPECQLGTTTSFTGSEISSVNCDYFVSSTRDRSSCPDAKQIHRTPSKTSLTPPLIAPLCNTCIFIPGYLLDEYQQCFSGCIVCGYMTAEILDELVASEGELRGLAGNSGRQIFRASKELQNWCCYVTKGMQQVRRKSSRISLADTLPSRSSSSRLKRSGAIRRSLSTSTTSSDENKGSEYPIPVAGPPEDDKTYIKRFSFDPIPVSIVASPVYLLSTDAISSGSSLGDPFFLEAALNLSTQRSGRGPLELAKRPDRVKRTFSEILGHSSRPTVLRRSPGIHPLVPHPRSNEPLPSPESDGEIRGEDSANIANIAET